MNSEHAPVPERPLSATAKGVLIASTVTTILLFYVLALTSVLLLLALLGFELLLTLGLARFGLARFMIPVMNRHFAIVGIFCRILYSRKEAEYRISLKPEDAPGLFAILEKLSRRMDLAMPRVVSLEMTANAWVRLKGFRRGAGTTFLGIGYDLLAGLSEAEAEAVLAHEMAHAKLIQRGIRSWTGTGMSHVWRLAYGLNEEVSACQRSRVSCSLAEAFLRGADWFARLVTRLVATYSRQEEFAADRGAAEICGAAAIRSALIKIEELGSIAERLPWRERVAQLQLDEGFSQWLIKELTTKHSTRPVETKPQHFNKYSTHPLLRDRLAALPPAADHFQTDRKPAIALLADPDAAAEKLIAEVLRVAAQEEQKDSEQLRKWTRKGRGSTHLRPLQLAGVCTGLAAIIGAVFGAVGGFTVIWMAFIFVAGGLAVLLYREGRYRDFIELPIPDYSILKQSWEKPKTYKNMEATQNELEKELRQLADRQKNRTYKAQTLASESYSALKRCDYLRAHVAARLCLQMDNKSVEGTLALAIASAALGQSEQSGWALRYVHKITGLKTASTAWGAAWSLLLSGGWTTAEACMTQARKDRENEPTLLLVLALCQARRGKLQSAILSARQACTPAPRNKEHAKLLINLLLEGGYLREAQERLKLQTQIRGDTDLMFSMLRLKLQQRDFPAASEWTQLLKERSSSPHLFVRLGGAYFGSRKNEEAAAFYEEALTTAFYPEACLGLARIQAQRQNKEEAQSYLLAALDLDRTLGEDGVGPLPLFHQIIGELVQLQDPIPNCQAWIARLNGSATPAALANTSFMIYATHKSEAEKHLSTLLNAMRPSQPPLVPTIISWQEAPWQQKPDGPVRPGVQGVLQ
jgi:Zn-dependent protease with chaperone function